ncbi:MAG: GGDEF domain-containing protein [Butyrivibrio sp.]|nr:GGDEF domain-containing protein [Butyrivibrio sp.]
MFKEFILQNWSLYLVLLAFVIMLKITIFLEHEVIRRMYVLIALIFLLSISVFVEFSLESRAIYPNIRIILMAIRYSATPLIIAQIIYTLVIKEHWTIFLPSVILVIIDFVSIKTGIVFSIAEDGSLKRGLLGYLPFIVAGIYCLLLIYFLVKRSTKLITEIIPIVFLAFCFLGGLILPFIIGKEYARIFCPTIGITMFVYYVFSIFSLTKKDAMTQLLNRQAYYNDITQKPQDISSVISLDMNGLKTINDTYGHAAGDKAIKTLAECVFQSLKSRQLPYRIGGDEFAILCRRTSLEETREIAEKIRDLAEDSGISCSIGYCIRESSGMSIGEMLAKADEMMYAEKARYYQTHNRRKSR